MCGGLTSSGPFSTGTCCYPEMLLWGFWLWGAHSPPLRTRSAACFLPGSHISVGPVQTEQHPETEMVLLPVSQQMARGCCGWRRDRPGQGPELGAAWPSMLWHPNEGPAERAVAFLRGR